MKISRQTLPCITDDEGYQQALLLYNEVLLHFHTLPAEADASLYDAARSAFESAGRSLDAAVDCFVVGCLQELLRRLRK